MNDRELDIGCDSKGHMSTGVPAAGVTPTALPPAASEAEFLEEEAGGRPLAVGPQSPTCRTTPSEASHKGSQGCCLKTPSTHHGGKEPAFEQRSPGR